MPIPTLPDDRFEWTPRDIAHCAHRRTDQVTRRCRELQRRNKLRKDGARWRFDHATAERVFREVLRDDGVSASGNR